MSNLEVYAAMRGETFEDFMKTRRVPDARWTRFKWSRCRGEASDVSFRPYRWHRRDNLLLAADDLHDEAFPV